MISEILRKVVDKKFKTLPFSEKVAFIKKNGPELKVNSKLIKLDIQAKNLLIIFLRPETK